MRERRKNARMKNICDVTQHTAVSFPVHEGAARNLKSNRVLEQKCTRSSAGRSPGTVSKAFQICNSREPFKDTCNYLSASLPLQRMAFVCTVKIIKPLRKGGGGNECIELRRIWCLCGCRSPVVFQASGRCLLVQSSGGRSAALAPSLHWLGRGAQSQGNALALKLHNIRLSCRGGAERQSRDF